MTSPLADPQLPVPSVAELLNLTGKVALITGASGNIGAGIAARLHEAGASVVLHSNSNPTSTSQLKAQLRERAELIQGDVEHNATTLVTETIKQFGRLDIVINNAGIQPVKALVDLAQDDIREMLRVNVGGVIALTSASVSELRKTSGCIVNIASIEGLQPAAMHSHYCASKAAVLMHTRAAAQELGPQGIRVNAVAPGLIDVAGLSEAWPSGVERWHAACPLSRLGQAADVADAVLFLASAAARWVTGTTVTVDGGVLTNNTW